MQDLMQIPDRMKWYEARFCADDMPDWYPGSYVRTEQVSPALRNVVIKAEINREKVPLRNAYKTAGQKARVRLSNGVEHCLQVANAPHAEHFNKDPLFRVKGDMIANETKSVKEVPSIMAEVHLLVSNEEAPDIYAMTEEDSIEVGPFVGAGLDLRSSGLLAIFRYPTLVLFVEGRGIATARALIESPSSVTNLGLEFRQDVRMYYRAPNEASLCYKELIPHWESLGVTVHTTTSTLQDAFDDDDTLMYDPDYTGAIILTGGDEEAEKAARQVCKEAEISVILSDSQEAKEPLYLDSTPKSFQMWDKTKRPAAVL
eukprot:jgi/Chrzof1/2689/Cz11g25090.t1